MHLPRMAVTREGFTSPGLQEGSMGHLLKSGLPPPRVVAQPVTHPKSSMGHQRSGPSCCERSLPCAAAEALLGQDGDQPGEKPQTLRPAWPHASTGRKPWHDTCACFVRYGQLQGVGPGPQNKQAWWPRRGHSRPLTGSSLGAPPSPAPLAARATAPRWGCGSVWRRSRCARPAGWRGRTPLRGVGVGWVGGGGGWWWWVVGVGGGQAGGGRPGLDIWTAGGRPVIGRVSAPRQHFTGPRTTAAPGGWAAQAGGRMHGWRWPQPTQG